MERATKEQCVEVGRQIKAFIDKGYIVLAKDINTLEDVQITHVTFRYEGYKSSVVLRCQSIHEAGYRYIHLYHYVDTSANHLKAVVATLRVYEHNADKKVSVPNTYNCPVCYSQMNECRRGFYRCVDIPACKGCRDSNGDDVRTVEKYFSDVAKCSLSYQYAQKRVNDFIAKLQRWNVPQETMDIIIRHTRVVPYVNDYGEIMYASLFCEREIEEVDVRYGITMQYGQYYRNTKAGMHSLVTFLTEHAQLRERQQKRRRI